VSEVARRLPGHDTVRGEAIEVRIADTAVRAFPDESIAAAAIASGTRVLARSLKYHRPRTFFCLEGHCSGCLVRLSGVPNLRACQAACTAGAEVSGQNAFPSAEVDLLGAVDFLFSRGMDHHTLMTGSSVLNKLANKVVRQLSGLGKLPDHPAAEIPGVAVLAVDVCVIGGGPAGLAAATTTARAGRSTVLIDDQLRPGGSFRGDPRTGRNVAESAWAQALAAGVQVLARSTAIGYFTEDQGGVLAVSAPDRLYRVHATSWIWATGGYAVNLPFPDNDRPGVLAARAVGRLLVDHGILGGEKICLVEVPEVESDATALALALYDAGAEVVRIALGNAIGTRGRSWVSALDTSGGKVDCDLIAVAGIPAPASEGPRQQGCRVVLDPIAGGFRVVVDDYGRTTTPGVWACGDVTGYVGPAAAADDGARVGGNVVSQR
jgi:sarcosine oxidase, subunit alpha